MEGNVHRSSARRYRTHGHPTEASPIASDGADADESAPDADLLAAHASANSLGLVST